MSSFQTIPRAASANNSALRNELNATKPSQAEPKRNENAAVAKSGYSTRRISEIHVGKT